MGKLKTEFCSRRALATAAAIGAFSPLAMAASVDMNTNDPGSRGASAPLLGAVADSLEEAGIKPHLFAWSLALANPSTGPRQDEYTINNDVFVGADFDLDKLAGVSDAVFHLEYIFFPANHNIGSPPASAYQGAVGGYFGGSPSHNDISRGYLSQFALEQTLFDGRFTYVLGRSNAERYFFKNNCSSVITCNDPIWDNSTGVLPIPYGSWGAFGRLGTSAHTYVKAGAFESDPQQYLDKGNGFSWGLGEAAGESIMVAVGRKTDFADTRYPGQYELIGFSNTSDQIDPRTGLIDETGTEGVIFKFRQALWREPGPLTQNPKALQLFGSLDAAPGDNQPYQAFAEVGLTYRQPFNRPYDTVSMKVAYAKIGDRQLEAQRMLRVASGGEDRSAPDDTYRIEANYHVALPWNAFAEPTVQYVINPSNFYNPAAPRLNDDGVVVGVQLGIDIGKGLGF
ncbi:OprB family carbohydrate-selective porin [Salinisphaera orenii MK-B5]|uniref:OprB family carbohydrate-selective porin n=1 Tax=Salinisphaera orenii MK-B5 TaxID=856730 RepID=A0A423PPT6_9GAMM|nr:carbohydrate porin [Salinisphaera orenii]ROO27625.1 OprB family carbohydrate-selective porin [Salinisphaera orenii MK-B5]